MIKKLFIIACVLAVIGAAAGGALYYAYPNQMAKYAGMTRNYFLTWSAPPGTTTTELNAAYKDAGNVASPPPAEAVAPAEGTSPRVAAGDWPSYNRTLTSERYSPLSEINTKNVGGLKVLCTYDIGRFTGFESGLIMVDGALIGTTEFDIFSLNPATCAENWRTHEDYPPALMPVNRGAAYMDGMLFRGTQDGRALAYDFKTGKRIWETTIGDPKKGESAPAAPIAWNGLVFIGNAGGDFKGVKGRMYALDAKTGKIVWEFYLVPKAEGDPTRGPQGTSPLDKSTWGNSLQGVPITGGATWTSYTLDPDTGLLYVPGGNPAPDFAADVREGSNLYSGSVVVLDAETGAYKNHFKILPKDWHDWDVSGAPAIIKTAGGKKVLSLAPKDGHLYGFDLDTNALLYRQPVTRMENETAPFVVGQPVHFCPGSTGGAEWNGPAYDPQLNLVVIGEVEWCTTITLMPAEKIAGVAAGKPWSGEASINPFNTWGKADPTFDWAGWVYAVDADTGAWKWRLKSNYPILGSITPTAGGVVFFGDIGGNFYALDAANGQKLWGQDLGGAIGGGVITYMADGAQKVAVAAGFTHIGWPTKIVRAKIVVLGLDGAAAKE
jgi:alcohol dehydrogenase (cytochrome c)